MTTCDFCKDEAVYDGRTVMGPWAMMCPEHYMEHGVGLGVGKGQFLLGTLDWQYKLDSLEQLRGEDALLRDAMRDVLGDDTDGLIAELEDIGII